VYLLKKRLIVLVALAVVIAATIASTASAALVDNGGVCFIRGGLASCVAKLPALGFRAARAIERAGT
jgi:hypothetical protein